MEIMEIMEIQPVIKNDWAWTSTPGSGYPTPGVDIQPKGWAFSRGVDINAGGWTSMPEVGNFFFF